MSWSTARPPPSRAQWSSPHRIFCFGSWGREGNKTGRRPTWSARSALRAARLAERTDEKVATASTKVPTAVADAETVPQSVVTG